MSVPLAAMVQVPFDLTEMEPGRLVPMSTLSQPFGNPFAAPRHGGGGARPASSSADRHRSRRPLHEVTRGMEIPLADSSGGEGWRLVREGSQGRRAAYAPQAGHRPADPGIPAAF